jgi:hypothetical protein
MAFFFMIGIQEFTDKIRVRLMIVVDPMEIMKVFSERFVLIGQKEPSFRAHHCLLSAEIMTLFD